MPFVKVVGAVSGGSGSVAVVNEDVSVRELAGEAIRLRDFAVIRS